ncbi:hypothetical protein CBL_07748 [Carabus blaptoides fortunei]
MVGQEEQPKQPYGCLEKTRAGVVSHKYQHYKQIIVSTDNSLTITKFMKVLDQKRHHSNSVRNGQSRRDPRTSASSLARKLDTSRTTVSEGRILLQRQRH